MAFKDRVVDSDFNYELLINEIRPMVLNLQSKIQGNEKSGPGIKEEMIKELTVYIRRYLQLNFPGYVASTNDIVENTYSSMYGLGLLDKYLAMPDVNDVFLFGRRIMYIKNGERILADEVFATAEDVKVIYKKIASNAGQNISTQEPSKDAELLDGSRTLLIIEPEGVEPYIAIRKHTLSNISIDDLVLDGLDADVGTVIETKKESISETKDLTNFSVRKYLKESIVERKNILFVGGTGSGKTTFMGSLTHYIQKNHIVAVLEDTRELTLPLPFVYYLKTREGDDTVPAITYEDILQDCLRANPDRIMLTEIRSGESAYSLLQVLNSGHNGSMSSIHSNSCLDAIDKLEELITEHKNIPKQSLRGLISKAIDVVVYLKQDEDDKGNKTGRSIKEVLEITGLNHNTWEYETKYIYFNR